MSRFAPLVLIGSLAVVACGVLSPPKSPEAERLECRAKALAPLYPVAVDALRTARAVDAGDLSLGDALAQSGAALPQALAAAKAFRACTAGIPADALNSDAGSAEAE